MSKERDYFRAVRRVAAAVNSEAPLQGKLATLVRTTARAAKSGASLILLDATETKLVHSASWGLPYFFLQKGLLDPDKSLSEVITLKPVAVTDVANDKRIQYPEMAKKSRDCLGARRPRNSGGQSGRCSPALFAGKARLFRAGY